MKKVLEPKMMKEKKIFSIKRSKNVENNLYWGYKNINLLLKKYPQKIQEFREKKSYYKDIIISFDIETSSFLNDDAEKVSIMYEWSLSIETDVIIGRTWEQFIYVYDKISEHFYTENSHRIIFWVHNLSYEFQFIRKRFNWVKVFSLSTRKPIQCITDDGIEFRCTYALTGYSLDRLSKQLTIFKIEKLKDDLDYNLIRHYKTELTPKEIMYCINDVLIIYCYIAELILKDCNIAKIPLTKTSYVRNYCRHKCLREDDDRFDTKFKKYHKLMKSLVLDKFDYNQLKLAFSGGFTHASPLYSGKVIENVGSFDFGSSYPYVMLSEKFPMSSPEKVIINSDEELSRYLDNYCCLFDVKFNNIYSIFEFDNYISKSHCRNLTMPVENNGRIVSAVELELTVTEIDYQLISQMYDWESVEISHFRIFKKQYLPTDFIKSILKLYVDKTILKGIEGKEAEYMRSKENVNSAYGMMVTDIAKDDVVYKDNKWETEKGDLNEKLLKYNKSFKRFLYYPWGVWVTAYARRNLFTGIFEFGEDYIYSDTDSIKGKNVSRHLDYINKYNEFVLWKLEKAMKYHNIDIELTRPKNKNGEIKQIGVWEYECNYKKFKTLGAKRYMYQIDNKINLTVSGLNKKVAIPYLIEEYGENIFEAFEDNLYIPKEFTGKLTHTYIDEERYGSVVDYLGEEANYNELSSTHLEPAEFTLSLMDKYIEFLLGIQQSR